MRKIIDNILKSISGFWQKLEGKERTRLIVLAAAIIILAVVVAVLLGRTTYVTLYSGMDAAVAGKVITELDALNVPYKAEGTGHILVPEDQVSKVKMQLATLGYGTTQGFDYSLFADSGGFGTTDYQLKQQNLQFTEYQVREQLLTLGKINDCLVKIYLPDTSAFVFPKDGQGEASATVTLKIKAGATLDQSEVDAIAAVVAGGTSVPIENISIVDDAARLYTIGGDETSGQAGLSHQLALENQVREQLETQVVNLLSSVFGNGKVKASVGVTLNFDDETVQSVEFAPPVEGSEEGLVISMSELYEYTRDADAEGVVGTDPNGVGTVEYPYGDDTGYDYRHIAREFNYEINETVTQIQKAKATIKSLSIAVLIDSGSIEADYTENVRNLVVNAIGVNENYISVERLPFQDDTEFDAAIEEQKKAARISRILDFVKYVIRAAVIVLLALAVLSFLRTLLKAVLPAREPELAAAGGPPASGAGELIDYMAGDAEPGDVFDDVDLKVKSDTVSQLEKIIDKDSKAIAQLLRNWLADDE